MTKDSMFTGNVEYDPVAFLNGKWCKNFFILNRLRILGAAEETHRIVGESDSSTSPQAELDEKRGDSSGCWSKRKENRFLTGKFGI